MKMKGFTLIELLIVVAIIGILAAIAIPNFLQAQMRAKIARTEADMASTNTGLELYRVDNNAYPEQGMFGYPSYMNYVRLTTPVEYLSSWSSVVDPFLVQNPSLILNYYRSTNCDWYKDVNPPVWQILMQRFGSWRIYSPGPTQVYHWFSYDPTNGTVSNGDLIRSQKYGRTLRGEHDVP